VKLLFDQNLAPRLPGLLDELYPGSLHVRDVDLHEASDAEIWAYAEQNGFVIVSKDSDFQQRSLLLGHPPKFVWLRVGNSPTSVIEALLRAQSSAIQTFEQSSTTSHLMLP
jgi:predicted nuclease of predicted toxin-antitoxin system